MDAPPFTSVTGLQGVTLTVVVVIMGVVWKVLVKVSRIMEALADYPPHRHVNGKILFPKGYEPGAVERMSPSEGR